MLLRPIETAYATAGIIGTMSGIETISFVINMRTSTEMIKAYTILNIILLDSELELAFGSEIPCTFVADFSVTLI
jgi:hypothetical protein